MVGRETWRRVATFVIGVAACSAFLFLGASWQPQAQSGSFAGSRSDLSRQLVIGSSSSEEPAVISFRSGRALALEELELLRQHELIRFNGLSFDPVQQPAVDVSPALPAVYRASSLKEVVPAAMRALGDVEYHLVQYHRDQQAAFEQGLQDVGAFIVASIPNKAVVVRVEPSMSTQLRSLPGVRWSGAFHPSYKLAPQVVELFENPSLAPQIADERGRVMLDFTFYTGIDTSPYEELVRKLPGSDVLFFEVRDLGGRRFDDVLLNPEGRARISVLPTHLEDVLTEVAAWRDLWHVAVEMPSRTLNDHSVWYLQTGIEDLGLNQYDLTAKLFRQGITGRGLMGAVADTGVENDQCYFRYGPAPKEAAWITGPHTSEPTPQEFGELDPAVDEEALRTRLRKVVAYYVVDQATAYASNDQHGTGVAGCMLADNYGFNRNGALAARPFIRDLGFDQYLNRCDRPDGQWEVGDSLRPDLAPQVDDPTTIQDEFPQTFGDRVQHHDVRDGMAPGAQLVMQDIGNDAGLLVSTYTGFGILGQAYETGATAWNASFGTFNPADPGGCTDCYFSNAREGDQFQWLNRDFLIFASAGNQGNIGAASIPGGFQQGKNGFSVGATVRANSLSAAPATRSGENIANFSSKGPTTGGQLSPHIVAPGVVDTVATEASPTPLPETGEGSGNNDCLVPNGRTQGTSFSSPTAAGLGLLVQQYYYDGYYPTGEPIDDDMDGFPDNAFRPTNALVKATIINSARNLRGARTNDDGTGQAARPNFGQGWGAPRLDDTLFFDGDPTDDDPEGDTERARVLVLTDTPNGVLDTTALTAEPGGRTRDEIVQVFQPAFTREDSRDAGRIVEFPVRVVPGEDPTDPAHELRATMCYMDFSGAPGAAQPRVNDLDLEVVSPSGIVYRTNPMSAWADGYSIPAQDQEPQEFVDGVFTDYADRDPVNTCENVFIRPEEVESGTYTIRVIPFEFPPGNQFGQGYPNFQLNDFAPDRELMEPCGDGPDTDTFDRVGTDEQGFSVVVSGSLTTEQGVVTLNRATFDCSGQELIITVLDENGDDPPEMGCEGREEGIRVTVTTTTPSAGFTSDLEVLQLEGTAPTYRSDPLPVVTVNNPDLVRHGDGVIQVAVRQSLQVRYLDKSPCNGQSRAQAVISCSPTIGDSGFAIANGCDQVNPGVPDSTVRPDNFMDADELVRYTAFFVNNGTEDLNRAIVSLRPDPTDPVSQFVTVLDPFLEVVLAPPGRRSDATFSVLLGARCSNEGGPECDPSSPLLDGIPPQHDMDFIVCVSSPTDQLFDTDCFRQEQVLEADIQQFRYDTRDPNGELFGFDGIRRPIAGADEDSMNPSDFIENDPMWFDPDADCDSVTPDVQPCAELCNVPRNEWDAAANIPPGECFFGVGATGNPFNPFDFDDSQDGFEPATYAGDGTLVGPPVEPGVLAQTWFWASSIAAAGIDTDGDTIGDSGSANDPANPGFAPEGGGCGWEDELVGQLEGARWEGHPDNRPDPWGIWQSGAINRVETGPFPVSSMLDPINRGVPQQDTDPDDLRFGTILWDPPGPGDNSGGQWCESYLSDTSLGQFYRSFLIPPTLNRVHNTNPEFRVEFQELRWFSRLDAHTINGDNLFVAGWHTNNQLIEPLEVDPVGYAWSQYQNSTIIFSDDVREDWAADDNFLDDNLRALNEDFPDLTYEDLFGPASEQFNFAFSWSHLHFDGRASQGQYGWGIDDVSFIWTESRDVDDQTDCADLGITPRTIYMDANRYNACNGKINITLFDVDQTADSVAVCVASAAEDFEKAILERVEGDPNGRYEGMIDFGVDPSLDVDGRLLVLAGQVDIGNSADTVRVEYDPLETDPGIAAEDVCDWLDADENGINDDDVDNDTLMPPGDGIPDAEDGSDVPGMEEELDFAGINCTSGVIFPIRTEVVDGGQSGSNGDEDGFADHGETVWFSVSLQSRIGSDLTGSEVCISTDDPTVCIEQDCVIVDVIPGDETIVDTPIDPFAVPERQGFRFSVPTSIRTTDLTDPQTVTFRVDVEGTNAANLNEFSTRGEGFNSFLPIEVFLPLDLDIRAQTAADYDDFFGNLREDPREPGQFFEGFDAPAGAGGFEHPPRLIPAGPGWQVRELDGTTDTRFGTHLNGGFCPECPLDSDCTLEGEDPDCDFPFQPGSYPRPPQIEWTDDFAYEGSLAAGRVQSMKFGEPGVGPDVPEQNYAAGQFATLEAPPMRISMEEENPELEFRFIGDGWLPFFTSGLITPIGGVVLEVSSNPQGLDDVQVHDQAQLTAMYPTSSFRRLYAYDGGYDTVTDALNACRTLFCAVHHPVYSRIGDPLNAATDDRRGDLGGTWERVRVDLSDYRGQQVVLRWTWQVLQDLDIQPGNIGALLDSVSVTGLSTETALDLEDETPATVPCGLIADFGSTSPDCTVSNASGVFQTQPMALFEQRAGLGLFDDVNGEFFPVEYEWIVGPNNYRLGPGLEGDDVGMIPGVRGTFDGPTFDFDQLQTETGITGPGTYNATLVLYQNGMEVARVTKPIVVKDFPIPVISMPAQAFSGGSTALMAMVSVQPSPDPARELSYRWDFGDGTSVDTTGPEVSHVFTLPEGEASRDYTVTLCVSDEDGCEGCSTQTVTVIAAPTFLQPQLSFVDDCSEDAVDGNGDLNEYIRIAIDFLNDGANATDVTGFLTSSDDDVEIFGGVADYGDVAMGARSSAQTFTFIRRGDADDAAGCLVVPLTLTLVSNDGTVVQRLDLAFPMGVAPDTQLDSGVQPDQATCVESPFPVEYTFAGPSGCLDGMRLALTVDGVARATVGAMNVFLRTPSNESYLIHSGRSGDTRSSISFDVSFGVDADAPVGDTGGVLVDTFGNLFAPTAARLIEDLTGTDIAGDWTIVVESVSQLGEDCTAGTWTVSEAVLQLEGKDTQDVVVATESACADCIAPTAPIFDGISAECALGQVGVGILSWRPAEDPAECTAGTELQYDLFVSDTPGQLGVAPTFLDPGQTCDDCPMGETCAFPRNLSASVWTVCGLETSYWTVVVSDGGAPGTFVPDVDTSNPAAAVPAEYQSAEGIACLPPPDGPEIRVRKTGSGETTEYEIEMMPGMRDAERYIVFRGEFAGGGRPEVLGARAQPYNHASVECDAPLMRPTSTTVVMAPSGPSFYFLVAGENSAGCAGLGTDSGGAARDPGSNGCSTFICGP